MGTYEELKAAIADVIKTNGNNEITGARLKNVLNSIVSTIGVNATFAGIATPETNPGTPDQNVFYIATQPGTYTYFNNIIVSEREAVILSNKTGNWVKTRAGIATQQQLTEFSAEITSQLFEKGNVSNGNEVANDAVYRSLYIPCKQGDVISGKVYRVKVFDENYQYLGEEGTTLTGAEVDYVVENANCAYVRIIILTKYKDDCEILVNGVNALYLANKDAFNNIVSIYGEIALLKIGSCVYEITDDVMKKPILFAIKDMAIKAQEGYLYTIVLRNLANASQFSLYRALESTPTSLQFVANFITTSSTQQNGIEKYSLKASSGETASVIIDWDAAKGLESGTLYPNKYILKKEVFRGGLLSNNLIPQVSEIEGKVDALEGKVDALEGKVDALEGKVDALSVGGGAPKEKYWAVCGDSITNANHASIEDIEDSDPYCPFDGYTEVSTYKRKNYAYYIAQKARLKWANYGYGGTTLSSITSKAYGYKNAFVDERMRNLANKDWDYISIFFGGNDSYFGPTAQRDKWLQETYGEDIGYPVTAEQIGTPGFATLEQKSACDSITGEVAGVEYTDNNEYFLAKFIGSIDSMETDTWYGALNTCVQYLLANHSHAKIILIASYTPGSAKYADAVIEVAEKWGVRYFDFRKIPFWATASNANFKNLINPNREDGKWEMENGNLQNSTIYGRNSALYLYDGAHPTNRGYEEISHLMEQTIIA